MTASLFYAFVPTLRTSVIKAATSTRFVRVRTMATVKDHMPHAERTANDPRQTGLFDARISRIDEINSKIRLLRLGLPIDGPRLRHLPGQYLDVHIPNISQAGGFTITSPPSTTAVLPSAPPTGSPRPPTIPDPYVELAIQKSDNNPPAAYLWKPIESIQDAPLQIRVGGAFVYPPSSYTLEEASKIDRAVFIAAGVGINPIMSMLSAMALRAPGWVGGMVRNVRVLYSTRRIGGEEVLFEERLRGLAEKYSVGHAGDKLTEVNFQSTMFETSGPSAKSEEKERSSSSALQKEYRRITHDDLSAALGPERDRANTLVYTCGPPQMTDDFVAFLQNSPGMEERRVLCEKWW